MWLSASKKTLRIPLLLLHRTGGSLSSQSGRLPKGHHGGLREEVDEGMTLLIPKDWGFAFWHSFIFTGMRFMGLKERTSVNYEAGLPTYPDDYPECPSFPSLVRRIRREGQGQWERLPPAKRVNYAHHGIEHPPWDLDWSMIRGVDPAPSIPSPWALSPSQILDLVQRGPEMDVALWIQGLRDTLRGGSGPTDTKLPSLNDAIIRVRLSLWDRGAPGRYTPIYEVPLPEKVSESMIRRWVF